MSTAGAQAPAIRRLRVTRPAGRTLARDEPLALAVEVRWTSAGLGRATAAAVRRAASPAAAPAAAHAAAGAADGSPGRPRAVPGRAATASTDGLRHSTCGSRDRRPGHRLDLDVGARLISVDLQEHAADAQGRALVMGDDDLDLLHAGHHRAMTTDLATGLPRATALGAPASSVPQPGGLMHDTDR